jgi:hypothetical protein
LTLDLYGFSRESCLNAEHATGSTLTFVAMADRDANRLAGHLYSEFATGA